MMKQISVGTCVPGSKFERWAPQIRDSGFECFAICFHMSLGGTDLRALADRAAEMLAGTNIRISALGFYCNALTDPEHRAILEDCIDLARAFHTDTVSTFAGALEGRPVDEALPVFGRVFGELARRAEGNGVRIAIENCPMGGTWRSATCNIGFNARAWERMFNEVASDALGLEWEPAHQMYQLVDPVANLRAWGKKVFHLHGKDAAIKRDVLRRDGIYAPEEIVDSRFPGFGETDWRQIFAILHQINYGGAVSIEGYHDPYFAGDWEMTGQTHALKYLKWCRGGSFIPNPWDK